MPGKTKDLIQNMYSFDVGFNYDNKNSYSGKTIGESDLKKLIKEPADGDLRLKITKSKSRLDKESNLVPDPTKGETQLELGKDFLGVKFRKKFSRGGGVAIKGTKFTGVK
jgi:hypothetical protein